MFVGFHNQYPDKKQKIITITSHNGLHTIGRLSRVKWQVELHTWTCSHSLSQSMILIGTLFTVKVIINTYDSVSNFFIVLGLFCVGLFLLLCFQPREVTLVFVLKLFFWCWVLLTLACLKSFWFLHQIWTRVLLGRVFVVVGSSFSSL